MATQEAPFGSLLTPEVLAARRRAEFDAEYQGVNPWVAMAAEAGFNAREIDRARGIGLTPEDKKAQTNQRIMKESQAEYERVMSGGTFTADEAQAMVLEKAIKEFAKNGEWEQALAMTQPLNALKEQAAQRRKLLAEAANLESKPDAKALDQELTAIKNQQAYEAAMGRLEVARMNAQTAQERLDVQMQIAQLQAEVAQAKIDAKANAPAKKTAQQYKHEKEINDAVAGASHAANIMADLRTQIKNSPGALTLTGELSTQLASYATAARAALQTKGWNPDHLRDSDGTVTKWVNDNIQNVRQKALVVQLAFAFARANDPGGRLSNQDLEQAKLVVTGEGTAKAKMDALDQAFAGLARSTADKINTGIDMQVPLGARTNESWVKAVTRYGGLAKASVEEGTRGPTVATGAPDAEGWMPTAEPGVRIRTKAKEKR